MAEIKHLDIVSPPGVPNTPTGISVKNPVLEPKNTILGDILTQGAALFEGVAAGQDTGNRIDIRESAQAFVDQANNEFGVNDAVALTGTSLADVPRDIVSASKNVESLTNAFNAGTLKETHYWTRLEASARQLRARYPGYRDVIDNEFGRITGRKPANAVRQGIFDEMSEAQRTQAASLQKDFNTIEQGNASGKLNPVLYAAHRRGEPGATEQALAAIGAQTFEDQEQIRLNRIADSITKQKNINKEELKENIAKRLNLGTKNHLFNQGVGAGLRINPKDGTISDALIALSRGAPGAEGLLDRSPEQMQATKDSLGLLMLQRKQEVQAIVSQPDEEGNRPIDILSTAELTELENDHVNGLLKIQEYLFDGELSFYGSIGALEQYNKSSIANELYRNYPDISRQLAALSLVREAVGTLPFDTIYRMLDNTPGLDGLTLGNRIGAFIEATGEGGDVNAVLTNLANKSPTDVQPVLNALGAFIEGTKGAQTNKELAKTVSQIYLNGEDFLKKLDSKSASKTLQALANKRILDVVRFHRPENEFVHLRNFAIQGAQHVGKEAYGEIAGILKEHENVKFKINPDTLMVEIGEGPIHSDQLGFFGMNLDNSADIDAARADPNRSEFLELPSRTVNQILGAVAHPIADAIMDHDQQRALIEQMAVLNETFQIVLPILKLEGANEQEALENFMFQLRYPMVVEEEKEEKEEVKAKTGGSF